jgi:hypothetical protein
MYAYAIQLFSYKSMNIVFRKEYYLSGALTHLMNVVLGYAELYYT